MNEIVLNHPLITHKLGILRDIHTGTKEFREATTHKSLIFLTPSSLSLEIVADALPPVASIGSIISTSL